jgi:hypothetical protein
MKILTAVLSSDVDPYFIAVVVVLVVLCVMIGLLVLGSVLLAFVVKVLFKVRVLTLIGTIISILPWIHRGAPKGKNLKKIGRELKKLT